MAESVCVVCREPIAPNEGESCLRCGGWFHFDLWQYPAAPACGVATDRVPGIVV